MFRSVTLIALLLVAGCASIPIASSPAASTAPSTLAPGTTPGAASLAPSPNTLESPTLTLAPTSPEPTTVPPTKTPKPSRKPRPSPTPTPIAIDLIIYVNTSDLPTEWHTNTDYPVPIHVEVAGASVPNAHSKVTVPEEAFSTSFDTGPLAPGDNYASTVTFNLSAMGPATLTLQVKAPAGYVDGYTANNKITITIQVLP